MNKSKSRLSRSFSLFSRKSTHESSNPDTSSPSPWKFWRRLSTRNRHDSKYSSPKDRPEIALLEKHDESQIHDGQTSPLLLLPSSGPLPDVVEKASCVPKFNGNSVPPPKPPRLFLFRTPSSTMRHSTENENNTDPMYMNSERVAELRAQRHDMSLSTSGCDSLASFSDSIKEGRTQEFGENNNIIDQLSTTNREFGDNGSPTVASKVSFMTVRQNSSDASSTNSSIKSIPQITHLNSVARKQRIRTPELNRKRSGRSFKYSSEKGETSRQKHIMNSISELLQQRLDPYPVMDQLKRAGVLTNVDVQFLLGHHDRKSVCEGIVGVVGDATPDVLSLFSDLLASAGNCTEILEVLQVMREMDRIIHEVSCNINSETTMLSDEKSFSFEIGYLSPDYTLKPLVELERVRASSDKRHSKASSRNSSYSLLEVGFNDPSKNVDSGIFPGLIMMSICVTGHSLSGQRAEALASLIRRHNCISELHIGKTRLHGQDICIIAKALEENRTIHLLDLRLNNIGQTGAIAVTDLLCKTKSLQILNLSSSNLELTIFKGLMAAVGVNKTLVDLDLSFLDINENSCDCLRDMLKVNTTLQKLRLRSNSLTWSGCYVLAEGLVRNISLSVLDLSSNTIGDDGAQALAKFLPESSVTEMCLENCGITSAGCSALAEIVIRCKKLKLLDISTNRLLDEGISKLATSLERSSSLENLGLNMCGVTNSGFSMLLDVLEKNTSIVHMKLCYNKLGQEQSDPTATSENLRYRLRIVTSSKPKLQILLWGNSFEGS